MLKHVSVLHSFLCKVVSKLFSQLHFSLFLRQTLRLSGTGRLALLQSHSAFADFPFLSLGMIISPPQTSVHALAIACAQLLSRAWLFATPRTVTHQAPLSMGFSKQEYWSGLPFPPPGDLPDPGNEPVSPASPHCRQILYHWATWEVPVHAGLSQMLLLHKVPWLFFHPSGSSFSSLHACILTDGAYFLYTLT